jgi:hypothetical protein
LALPGNRITGLWFRAAAGGEIIKTFQAGEPWGNREGRDFLAPSQDEFHDVTERKNKRTASITTVL